MRDRAANMGPHGTYKERSQVLESGSGGLANHTSVFFPSSRRDLEWDQGSSVREEALLQRRGADNAQTPRFETREAKATLRTALIWGGKYQSPGDLGLSKRTYYCALLQTAQSRSHLYTLGPKVVTADVLGAYKDDLV